MKGGLGPLRFGREQLQEVVALISNPAIMLDRSGSAVATNASFVRLAELLGAAGCSQLRALVAGAQQAELEALLSSEAEAIGEYEFLFKDGGRRSIRSMILPTEEGPARLVVIHEAEPNLLPARGADNPLALLRHEIAGPLTAILGTSEMLLMREEQLTPELRSSVQKIFDNCCRISTILSATRDEGRSLRRWRDDY